MRALSAAQAIRIADATADNVDAVPEGARRSFPDSFMRRAHHGVRARIAGAAIGAAVLVGLAATPATAQEIANVKSVDIAVQGSIAQRCQMGTIAATDFGRIGTTGNQGVQQRIQLDCNVPFTMQIKAQNGALAHSELPNGQGVYAGSVPYSLDVQLPVRRPTPEMISRVFEGRMLRGGQAISSNGGIAMDGLLLKLSLENVTSEAGLLAGHYGEVIEITIAPN
ncbi:hypothetical protein FHS95_003292 [Sphingomonas naasensis]|nr:hypothetical protein [Sphingomonas naasensis]NIJ21589.1 hypothetical protein [Sphingomonas naasensis]